MTAEATENQLNRELAQAQAAFPTNITDVSLNVGKPEGKGFIYGPMIGYRTDDKKWDFRAAVMWFGTYTTSMKSTFNLTIAGMGPFFDGNIPFAVSTDLEIEHRDIDARAGRRISDIFRVFAGYKYQSYLTKIDSSYNIDYAGIINFNSALEFSFEAYMHMPYIGLGIDYPITGMFTVHANFGMGLVVGGGVEQKLKINGTYFNKDLSNNSGEVKTAYSLFGDVNIRIKLMEKVNILAGYQYQMFTLKVEKVDLNSDGTAEESSSNVDIFHGFTLRAEYLFGI